MTEKVKQHAAPVTGSDEIDIGRLVGTIIEARWWVIGITAVFALCAVVYTFFATPIYSAAALVHEIITHSILKFLIVCFRFF